MFAELNHGRWIVRCPECPSASERGGPGFKDGKTFTCVDCGASGVPVWPADRAGIERVTELRPTRAKNWRPGEDTIESLERENELMSHELRN